MNPFIPLKEADIVIIHGRVSDEIINSLNKLNIKTIIPTIKCESVDSSIAYHPDIVMHPINRSTLIISPQVFNYYDEKLKGMGIILIKGESKLENKYPFDISYNVGRVKNFALHKFTHTDPILKSRLKNENIELINVNQGYSKCSMATVDENRIITSDRKIYLKLLELGCEALLINSGHVILENQKYGFFGGATGNFSPDLMLISGNIDNHPDNIRIKKFIEEKKIEILYLSNKDISDLGTIICLNSKV